MFKRLTWFAGGALAGALGADRAKRRVRVAAEKLHPANVARAAGGQVRQLVRRGGQVASAKQQEMVARARGRATSVADEHDDVDTVIVDGKIVEPGKVILLKQSDRSRTLRRRGA